MTEHSTAVSKPTDVRWSLVWWSAAVLPALLLTLHGLAILPLYSRTDNLEQLQALEGYAYLSTLPAPGYPEPLEPAMVVMENGRPLPSPNMPGWGTVAANGAGRFHVAGVSVFFSATDSSDPRTNGRNYSVTRPAPIPRRLVQLSWLVAVAATLIFVARHRVAIGVLLSRRPLLIAGLLLLAGVLANRAWFFTDFPVIAIYPDSGSYYAVTELLGTGVLPNFGNRPPVYPLFLKLVYSIVDRAMAVAYVQTALSALASLLLVYAMRVWHPALAIPAALVMVLYMSGLWTLELDTSMLSESVYASALMIGFAALIIGLQQRRARWLGTSSAVLALAILTRPAGIFLVVSYLLVMAWLIAQKFPRRAVVGFLLPFPILLLAMSAYNRQVVKAFAPTTWGEANLAVATFIYWETDPQYPAEINARVQEIQQVIAGRLKGSNKDRATIDRSSDPLELAPVFLQSFDATALNIAQQLGGEYETAGRAWIRRIAIDSIRKHPDYYLKFVSTMLYMYFRPADDYDFRAFLRNRVQQAYVRRDFDPAKGNPFMVRLGKEYATGAPPPSVVITNFDEKAAVDLGERIIFVPTLGWRVYHVTQRLRENLFEYWAWSAAVGVGLLLSAIVLVRTRFSDGAAFALFIVSVSSVGAALVVSMVEYSQPRYSYPMEWAYGICAILSVFVALRQARGWSSHPVRGS